MANTEAEALRTEYLKRLRQMLRRVPSDIREEAVREVETHIEDEWRALGDGLVEFQTVLERLGPPEAYGRDLALQLMLARGRVELSPLLLAWAALFWASTSLLGAVIVLFTALVLAYTAGMVVVALLRLFGSPIMLINAKGLRVLWVYADLVRFPPEDWSPAVIALSGVLPALLFIALLYRTLQIWLRSRLAGAGLAIVADDPDRNLPFGWERRAVLAILTIALISLSSCLLFVAIGNFIGIGRPGHIDLPSDFWRDPLGLLAFLSILIFLASPALGLIWTARRARGNSHVSRR